MAVGVAVSVSKVAVYSRMTEVNSFYARVVADGGTISDFSALRLAVLDYKAVQSLEPSLYTFASGRKAGVQYSLMPTDGSGDLSVTRSGDTAMELNANGFWQPVAANLPRYDYVGERPMINIEELRTNLLPRYKTFPHSDWIKSGARIEGDPTTAGADILSGWDFTNWDLLGATVNDNNTFTSSNSSGQGIRKNNILNANKLYRFTITGVTTSVGLSLRNYGYIASSEIIITTIAGAFSVSFYKTMGDSGIFFRNSTDGETTITTFTAQEVTGYASPFVDSSGNNLMDGYKLVEDTSNGLHITSSVNVFGDTYTHSWHVKKGERDYFYTSAAISGTNFAYALFNINTGVVVTTDKGTGNTVVATISPEVNGYYLCTLSFTGMGTVGAYQINAAVAKDEILAILVGSLKVPSYLGDGISGILIAHAQREAGATASSPIGGAEGSTQTRNADVISSAVDYSNIKTLVINNDAYVVETALPNNGYTLPQLDINKLVMFSNTLTDEQITANGWTKKVLAFAVSVDIAAGTTISIEVNGVGTIEWGDGTSDSYSGLVTKTHVYAGGYKGLILFTGTLTRFTTSSNANWYFNIKDAPANLTFLAITGSNTITGNIADAPANLTYLLITGSNTITGNIANAPANLTFLYIAGSNTITGNIANAPANLTYLAISGSNTVTGNIADAPANLTTLYIIGLNTLADYTAGRVWKTNYNYLYLRQAAGAGLSSTEVDNLLIDLAATTWGGSSRTLDIRGVNAARTSASDAAVLSLQAQSVTVLTN